MKTTGNQKRFTGAEYNQYDNTATYYDNGYEVATLNFDTNEFEDHDEMTEQQKDDYYAEMVEVKECHEDKELDNPYLWEQL